MAEFINVIIHFLCVGCTKNTAQKIRNVQNVQEGKISNIVSKIRKLRKTIEKLFYCTIIFIYNYWWQNSGDFDTKITPGNFCAEEESLLSKFS